MKTVLVVEDSEFYREILKKTLETECGVQVIDIASGSVAINVLLDQSPAIDAAVLDIMMKGHGGTVKDFLRKTPRYKDTLVIYFTALDSQQIDENVLVGTYYVKKSEEGLNKIVTLLKKYLQL